MFTTAVECFLTPRYYFYVIAAFRARTVFIGNVRAGALCHDSPSSVAEARWRSLAPRARSPNSCARSVDAPGRARTFAAGDVVWGPARGHASWPGKLRARLAGGRWAVRWFGARGHAALPQARLLTLSEGLDQHHAARTKHRKWVAREDRATLPDLYSYNLLLSIEVPVVLPL